MPFSPSNVMLNPYVNSPHYFKAFGLMVVTFNSPSGFEP